MKNHNGRQPNILRVLTYHRIANYDDRPWLNPGLISATPAQFHEQMMFLATHYNVVSIQDVLDTVTRRKPLPTHSVLLTFDDAYRDFGEHAWPILKKFGFPVTVFVPTAYPDHPERTFWWDKLHQVFAQNGRPALPDTPLGDLPVQTAEERRESLKRIQTHIKDLPHAKAMDVVDDLYSRVKRNGNGKPPVLGWDELRSLAGDGVTLGAHTQTHPVLTRVDIADARHEISGSQADLKREIENVLPIFSYPDGGHSPDIVRILKDEGFLLGFNGPAGHNDLNIADLFRIRRTNITPKSSPLIFRLRLSRWFSNFEKLRLRKRIKQIAA